jgi:hypothetical protein
MRLRTTGAGLPGGVSAGFIVLYTVALASTKLLPTHADIGLTIHPHPTLSETVAMAAEAFDGTITDLYPPKRKGEPFPGVQARRASPRSRSCPVSRRRARGARNYGAYSEETSVA